MITLIDTPSFLEGLEKKTKKLGQVISHSLADLGTMQCLTKDSELNSVFPSSLLYIVNGIYVCQHLGKTIRLYSNGDFILTPARGDAEGLTLTSEFGAEIKVITPDIFLPALAENKTLLADWLTYQNLETRIAHILCSLHIADEVKHVPEIRPYEEGDVIIREEDHPQEVFEMLSGSASVESKGISLATIKSGEVFGELSFFTGSKRTATVTALESCLVQVIDQQQFMRIMKYRPAMVEGMIRTLCNRLVDLNLKLSSM